MTEKQLENAMLQYLAHRNDCYAFKFKDQAKFINGRYRKSPWEINGVSDLCVLVEDHVLWIEVKTKKGRQSEHQKNFEKIITKWGGFYAVVRSIEELKELMDKKTWIKK